MLHVGKGNRLCPLLLTEALLLSVFCVYLEKSEQPMHVYSVMELLGIVQFFP